MTLGLEIAISAALVISGVFGLVGSFGLVKLSDTMQRLHAPTKATTLGVGGVLIASMLYFGLHKGHLSFHELLIALFLFLTAPITANFIAKVHIAQRVDEDTLPESECASGWAVFDAPPEAPLDVPAPEKDQA
ncbi:MAG: Na+/H+ antiporter subunit G [Maritimibacter sp.]